MSEDKDFYDIWEDQDKPLDDQKVALEAARYKSKRYQLDNRVYIVRGYDMFVVHSDDIDMVRRKEGEITVRDISIKKATMIKYTEDGQRQADK